MLILLGGLIGVCAMGTVLAGLLVLLRSQDKVENRWFFLFTLFLSLWVVSNFTGSSLVKPGLTEFLVKLDFSLALVMAWCFLYFVGSFVPRNINQNYGLKLLTKYFSNRAVFYSSVIVNIAAVILIFLDQVFLVSTHEGSLEVKTKNLFIAYAFFVVAYLAFALADLFLSYWKGDKETRNSLSLTVAGFSVAAVANILTNLIFPNLFTNRNTIEALNVIGYLGLFVMILCIFLAITTRKLFDIRLIVARSLGYVLSLGFITLIISALLFAISSLLESGGSTGGIQRVLYVIVTVSLVLTYPYLKRFFDRVTNKLFYRDAYDTQIFLSALNEILVANIKLDNLLKQTSDLIIANLKTESCLFIINTHQDIPERFIGSISHNLAREDINQLRVLVVDKNTKPIVVDELAQEDKLRQLLRKYNVGCVSHLMSIKGNTKESVGVLMLGDKSSGNPYNHQDVKTLEIVANELVIAIQNALRFEEIEKFNITLQQKVDAATTELRQANEKLKALDATKDEFISMASHQLRTPLTAVKGYLSMVLEGDVGNVDEKQKPMLNQAFNSAQRMVYLIADLLNVSRLKTGKFIIESHPTQLADVVEGELAQLTETAKAHKLHLVYNKPVNFPVLNLDETKIRQVIMNFVDNAIYYTPAGGTVTIELKDLGTSVQLTVTDTGIGVPKAAQPRLFSKFYRADNAQKARPDGTGLGLFMARKVVAAQGGSIVFKSTEGQGSTFGFSFPKAPLQTGTPATPAKASTAA
jgi:signal transduction histidine kinase